MKLANHPLLERGAQVTDHVFIWTLKEHPHQVVGVRRGFEVRIYKDDAWAEPFLVSMTNQASGHVMDLEVMPNAAAAEAAALEMLAALDGTSPSRREQ
jgi:hypothetical protein